MQVSHSKKWKSQKALDNEGNEILNDKGKPILIKSYILLQDRFYKYMSDNGYKDFIRGEKGSTAEHLSDIEFKAKKEREKLETITDKVKQQQNKFAETISATEDSERRKSQVQQVVSYIHNFEWLFIKEKQNASIEEQKAQIVKDKKQLTQYQQRLKEIDNLFSIFMKIMFLERLQMKCFLIFLQITQMSKKT